PGAALDRPSRPSPVPDALRAADGLLPRSLCADVLPLGRGLVERRRPHRLACQGHPARRLRAARLPGRIGDRQEDRHHARRHGRSDALQPHARPPRRRRCRGEGRMIEFIAENLAPIMFVSLIVFLLLGYPVAFALAANGLLFFFVGVELAPLSGGSINLSWPLLYALPERFYGGV